MSLIFFIGGIYLIYQGHWIIGCIMCYWAMLPAGDTQQNNS